MRWFCGSLLRHLTGYVEVCGSCRDRWVFFLGGVVLTVSGALVLNNISESAPLSFSDSSLLASSPVVRSGFLVVSSFVSVCFLCSCWTLVARQATCLLEMTVGKVCMQWHRTCVQQTPVHLLRSLTLSALSANGTRENFFQVVCLVALHRGHLRREGKRVQNLCLLSTESVHCSAEHIGVDIKITT